MTRTADETIQSSPSHDEKSTIQAEHHEGLDDHHQDLYRHGFSAEAEELPKGYFRSPYLIGSLFAVGMNLMCSTAGFALIAPVLGEIDVAIGPGPIIWIALVYTLGLALGLTLVGRLSDLFGRRWFFICGVCLGAIGAAVCATAKNIPVLIGGQTLIGLSASTGYSYVFACGELVPVKYRFWTNSIIFIFSLPTAGFGAAISTSLILHTQAGWRWCYYLLIILHIVAMISYGLFYFPPNFDMKHKAAGESRWDVIKNYDYVGTLLYMAGLLFFILGLSWGGNVYPWKDAHVIALVVVGFCCLVALFVYESKMPLKEPLVPIHMWKNKGWVASVLSLSFGASIYYSQAIVWPSMTATVYAHGRREWAGVVGSLAGIGITVGEIAGGMAAKRLTKTKLQVIAVMICATVVAGAMATCTPDTPNTAMALAFLVTFFVGYNEAIVFPITTICIRDQREIGTAAGIAGSSRSAISTVASTIYSVVLTSRITTTIPSVVPPAVVKAGLPASSVVAYMEAIAAGGSQKLLGAVPGLTPKILAVGARAYEVAYSDAYRTIYLVSIAFCGCALICNLFVPNVDDLMSNAVAASVGKKNQIDIEEAMVVEKRT